MKQKKRVISLLLVLVCAMSVLVACGKKTLESYYGSQTSKFDNEVKNLKVQYANTYSDIKYDITGNTITYSYYYKDTYSGTQKNTIKNQMEQVLPNMCKSVTSDVKKESGVKDRITVKVEFYNGDGTLLVSHSESK